MGAERSLWWQQRAVVSEATRKADARAQACRQLADKLVEHIGARSITPPSTTVPNSGQGARVGSMLVGSPETCGRSMPEGERKRERATFHGALGGLVASPPLN